LESIVTLTAPAEGRSVQIVRAVATGYAAHLPLGFDDVEDLRLVVSECCNRLLAAPSSRASLILELSVAETILTARLRLDSAPVSWPPEGDTAAWSWTLISQIVPSAREELAEGMPVIVVAWPLLTDATA
jgi:hypothetical protein